MAPIHQPKQINMAKTTKYHRFIKDGFVIPYNELLVDDIKYVEFEIPFGEDPHDPKFMAPESDESAEAREEAALEAARKLIAKADAKAKPEKK